MKIHFIKSKNPNVFSKLIEILEGSPYTHVAIETDLKIPGSEEVFVLEASWKSGTVLTPIKEITKNHDVMTFEDGVTIDWNKIRILMRRGSGVYRYGFFQAAGVVLRYLGIREPEWLIKRYKQESFCSQLVLDVWKAHKKEYRCEDYRTGPGRLLASIQLDPSIIRVP